MKNDSVLPFMTLACLVVVSIAAVPASAQTPSPGSPYDTIEAPLLPGVEINAALPEFMIYDSLYSQDKPDLRSLGFSEMSLLLPRDLWGRWIHHKPNKIFDNRIRDAVRDLPADTLLCLDVEHWPLYDIVEWKAIRNRDRLIRIVEIVREERPDLKIGYFGILPRLNYRAVRAAQVAGRDHPFFDDYHQRSKLLRPLADAVDVIMPVAYVTRGKEWLHEDYIREIVAEARMYNKPVVPFMAPAYRHRPEEPRVLIPAHLWRRYLNLMYHLADGVVVWEHPRETWDPNEPWITVQRVFYRDIR